MALYKSEQHPFSIQIPDDWEMQPPDPDLTASFQGPGFATLAIIEEDLSAHGEDEKTLAEAVDELLVGFSSDFEGLEVIKREHVSTQQGSPAERVDFSVGGGLIRGSAFIYLHDGKIVFVAMYIALGAQHGGLEPIIASSFDSFRVGESDSVSSLTPTGTPERDQDQEARSTPAATPTGISESAAQPLLIVNQGFGQDGRSIGYAFVVENPNTGLAVENTAVQIAFYEADGAVLSTGSTSIKLILPGQTVGIAGDAFVAEGVRADRIDVQLKPGRFDAPDSQPTLTGRNVHYVPNRFSRTVTGLIKNPAEKDVTMVRVSAVLYDETGAIIGGGFTFVDFVPANDEAAAEVSVTFAGEPANAELYPIITVLSEFE